MDRRRGDVHGFTGLAGMRRSNFICFYFLKIWIRQQLCFKMMFINILTSFKNQSLLKLFLTSVAFLTDVKTVMSIALFLVVNNQPTHVVC